jgi:1-acyl-sn-glycerol-3-phosphate acyltransferase
LCNSSHLSCAQETLSPFFPTEVSAGFTKSCQNAFSRSPPARPKPDNDYGDATQTVIRTLLMLTFWALALIPVALFFIPWSFCVGNVNLMYRMFMWGAAAGVRLTGVRTRVIGLDKLDPNRTYVFMSNHVSNIDPAITVPLLPRRTSVLIKRELFNIPIMGKAMRMGSMVPVDRGDRDAGIAAVQAAAEVVRQGVNMTIYVEGHRSYDGKLIPFKKGPFYLAEGCKVPVVPITIVGTHYVMPKTRFAIKPALVDVIFHDPIEPKDFGTRDELMEKVRRVIDSGLPPEFQSQSNTASA